MFTPLLAAIAITSAPSQDLKVTAWMVLWNPDCLTTFQKQAKKVDEIKLEWIGIDAEGMPFNRPHGTPEERKQFFDIAKANKVKTFAMVSNYAVEAGGFEATRVSKMLADPAKRAKHIQAMVDIVVKDKFDGLDLDVESLSATDRDPYSVYVEEVAAALKKAKKTLSVTVHAKDSEPGTWDGPIAQDWKRLGKAADIVKIMCYDFSWANSEAGPIAPTAWVEKTMEFAKTQIPAKKLDLGVAGYGYDWSQKPATSLTWRTWEAKQKDSTLCPLSSERINGKIHFGGADSYKAKKAVAQKLGLRGLALWYLGSEDPAIWGD